MTTATVDLERLAETTPAFRPMTVYGTSITPEMQRKVILRLAAAQKTRIQRNRQRRAKGEEGPYHWSNFCIQFDQTGLTIYLMSLVQSAINTGPYDVCYKAAKRLIQRWQKVGLILPCRHNLWIIPELREAMLKAQHCNVDQVEEITG